MTDHPATNPAATPIPDVWNVGRPGDPDRTELEFLGCEVLSVRWRDADGAIWLEPDLDVVLPMAPSLAAYPGPADGLHMRVHTAGLTGWSAAELAEATGLPVGAPYEHPDAIWPEPLSARFVRLNWQSDEPAVIVSARTEAALRSVLHAATARRPDTVCRDKAGHVLAPPHA
ncbi:hypothetical protein Cs7R123_43380 [Catellatospora sp. TT07R-123]|uniref:hypothetical protein n=1 Tax=Catellatospora sp. TT07R-123 TaxID=2733863 RepID=UPI001B2AB2C5|nr:hypothetical protein [Catellatospora sp. TT07R-123]GHJ46996.1 hypothetical protein Cs7R123_43380 [Catellatospora sp. TT07R-123]